MQYISGKTGGNRQKRQQIRRDYNGQFNKFDALILCFPV